MMPVPAITANGSPNSVTAARVSPNAANEEAGSDGPEALKPTSTWPCALAAIDG